MLFKSLFAVSILLFHLFQNTVGQGVYTEFGENRVSHKTVDWEKLQVKNDEIIFEKGQRKLAENISHQFIFEKKNLERDLQYQLRGNVSLVIFTGFSDYIQSNFGISNQQFYAGGYVYTPHNDIFVYFDGSYKNLMLAVKEGLARALINEMVLGGTMIERVQSSALVTLPEWFVGGLASYLAEPWNTHRDNLMRDATTTQRFKSFSSLDKDETIFAGHSFWFFIEKEYGKKVIRNILFQSKYFKNVESSLSLYTGENIRKLFKQWESFFRERYAIDEASFARPKGDESRLRKHSRHVHTGLNISPDGKQVSFITNNRGSYKVWVYDIQRKNATAIISDGFKTYTREPNYFFPVAHWIDKNKLAILDEKKGIPEINIYLTKSKRITKTINMAEFDWVKDFVFSSDGNQLVVSAIKDGNCNLYLQEGGQKNFKALTSDLYDIRDINFTENGDVLFVSNRHKGDEQNDFINFNASYGVFMYDIKQEQIKRITPLDLNVSYARPIHLGGSFYSFISDRDGIFNSYVTEYKSSPVEYAQIHQLTNYNRNILFQDVSVENGKLAELVFIDGRYRIFISNYTVQNPFADTIGIPSVKTLYRREVKIGKTGSEGVGGDLRGREGVGEDTRGGEGEDTSGVEGERTGDDMKDSIIQKKRIFQTGFPEVDYVDPQSLVKDLTDSALNTLNSRLEPLFKIDYFLIRIFDFNILQENYFQGGVTDLVFNTPLFSPHLSLSVSDLFNNHVLEAGARMAGLPLTGPLFGSDYYLKYKNRNGRINKEIFFNRRARFFDFESFYQRNIMTQGGIRLQYPLSEKSRIEWKALWRNDAHVDLAIDENTLNSKGKVQNLAGSGFAFVFDNTVSKGINRLQGTRIKAFAETYMHLGRSGTNNMLGLDARHYQPLFNQIVWANRFCGNTSLGNLKTAYYLGGPEQWYRPEFADNVAPLNDSEYILQAIGAPVRGFIRNARSGTSYFVLNSELRIPILPLFTQKPIRSEILKSFMLVGFADLGTAWIGQSPYTAGNPYNTINYNLPSLKVSVTANRNPFILGTGMGARIKFDSYYIKYDAAYGFMQDNPVKLHHYFSLGLDF